MRNSATGRRWGASTKIPHNPKMIDGTAASRSTIAPNGRASRAGAYWVRNTAIPTATGTANTSANDELSTVTVNRSRIPNDSFAGSLVLKSALVKKFAWFARNDGTARSNRNVAISPIAITIVDPAAAATSLNSRSPCHFTRSRVAVGAGLVPVGSHGPAEIDRVIRTSDHAMALTAVDNLDLNASGMGIYPLSAKPF